MYVVVFKDKILTNSLKFVHARIVDVNDVLTFETDKLKVNNKYLLATSRNSFELAEKYPGHQDLNIVKTQNIQVILDCLINNKCIPKQDNNEDNTVITVVAVVSIVVVVGVLAGGLAYKHRKRG